MNEAIKVLGVLPSNDSYNCLAFDVGRSQSGVAVGSSITRRGEPLKAIKFTNFFPDSWEQIELLLVEWDVELIIVGEPKDTPKTAKKMHGFAKLIHKKTSKPVVLLDESYSTVEAQSYFKKNVDKSKIDSYSAVIMIQQWFDLYG